MAIDIHTNGNINGHTNGNINGNARSHQVDAIPLRPGIYAPTLTFFHPDSEDLDLANIRKHAVRLARSGLMGLVTMGSNGEAVHLSRSEKALVTRTTRAALDEAGFTNIPVIAGTSEQSVRLTLESILEAVDAGADYALILPPSYYRAAVDREMLERYYTDVADLSPIPIILYNYPGAVAGVDMDSDTMITLAKHPNIVGTKFTCANTGKLTRVAAAADASTPWEQGSGYMALGGIADFTVPTLICGGSGIIAGGANVMPKVCVRVWDLYVQGKMAQAAELQKLLSHSDWVLTRTSIAGTKSACESYFGYGGYPRRPLKRLSISNAQEVAEEIAEIMQLEKSLPDVEPLNQI